MYKNMTRKSLALGAGLALVASALVATPAQAVATGSLWSPYGQTNEMVGVAGHVFTLKMGTPALVSGTTGTGQLAEIASQVSITMVENANVTTIVPTVSAEVAALDTASGTGTITAEIRVSDSNAGAANTDVVSGELVKATGLLEIAPPTTLTHSIQVDVVVTYDDGSTSETERITFVPANTVTASLTISPVTVGSSNQTISGTFTLDGINTANFNDSNFTAVDDAAGAGDISMNLVNGASAITSGTTIAYSSITDAYSISIASQTVAAAAVLTLGVTVGASTEVNLYFNSSLTAADAAQAKFTVATGSAYDSMDISTSTGTSVVHNKNASQATGSAVPAETIIALEGTKSMNFVIQAYTDGATRSVAASSGIPITVTLTDSSNGLGTSTITAGGKSLDVTGSSIAFSLTTNSNGQVAFTVAADNAVAGETFTIGATGSLSSASGAVLDTTTVKWAEATWSLLPAVDGNFAIAPGGSLAVDYTVVDQFGNLAGTDYQLAMTRTAVAAVAANRDKAAEYANWSYVAPVSATGRASATIVDNGLAATEGSDTVTVSLQKAASGGSAFIAASNSTNDTFVLTYENDLSSLTSTAKVSYNGIANAAGTTIAPIYIEADALVDYDNRTAALRPTKFDTYNVEADGVIADASDTADALLRVYGTVVTTGSTPVSGVAVKLSAAGLNFADKSTVGTMTRASNDSIVVFTDATGSYEAFVRSSTTGNVTIAVDAQGAASSVEVRFQNSTGVATGLTLTGPSSVASGARADFIATVVDKYGKAVSGVAVTFKDNGPGVLNTTAPVSTDVFGESMATLTTLAAEKGTTVVTAYATIGGVLVTQTATVTVGAAAAAATDVVVNVGSFNGKLVVYALNASGSEVSYKIAGKWVTQTPTSDTLQRYDRVVAAKGVTVKVDIYVGGVKQLSKSVVTK